MSDRPTHQPGWPDRPPGDDARLHAARDELRAEFGDPITVWGRSGVDAWDTVLGMLAHTGWTPPDG